MDFVLLFFFRVYFYQYKHIFQYFDQFYRQYILLQWNLHVKDTLGPARHLVLYKGVVLSLEVQNVL